MQEYLLLLGYRRDPSCPVSSAKEPGRDRCRAGRSGLGPPSPDTNPSCSGISQGLAQEPPPLKCSGAACQPALQGKPHHAFPPPWLLCALPGWGRSRSELLSPRPAHPRGLGCAVPGLLLAALWTRGGHTATAPAPALSLLPPPHTCAYTRGETGVGRGTHDPRQPRRLPAHLGRGGGGRLHTREPSFLRQHSTAPPGHPPLPAGGRLIPAAAWQGAPAAPARSPAPRPRKGPGPRGAARPRTRLRPGAAPARPAPPAAGARRRGAGGQGGRGRAACGGAISRNVQGNWHRPSSGHPAPAPATSRPGTAAAASPVSPAAPPLLTAARDEYGVEAHRGPADSHPPRHQKLGGGRGGADSPRGSQRRETAHEAALRPPTKRAVGGGWLVPEAAATRRAWPCTQSLPCSGGDHTHTRKRVPPHAACSHAQAVLCPAPRSRQRTRRSTRRCRARLGRLRFRQGSCAQPPQARPGALCHVPVSQGDDSGLASPRSGLR